MQFNPVHRYTASSPINIPQLSIPLAYRDPHFPDIEDNHFKILNFKDQVDHKISVKFSNYQRRVAESHGVLDAIGDTSGIARVRPEAILCDTFIAGRCASHLDDAPLYFDDNHLTNAGARLLVPAIMKQIDER